MLRSFESFRYADGNTHKFDRKVDCNDKECNGTEAEGCWGVIDFLLKDKNGALIETLETRVLSKTHMTAIRDPTHPQPACSIKNNAAVKLANG